jgi:hypothetical protein
MANWVSISVVAIGPAEEIERFKAICIRSETFDFNAIVLMPDAIKGTTSRFGYDCNAGLIAVGREDLLTNGSTIAMTLKHLEVDTVDGLRRVVRERHPDWISEAEKTVAVYDATGFRDWADWSRANWGTDRNAYDFGVCVDEPGRYGFFFRTADSLPVPVWEKMGKMFPDLDFELSGKSLESDFGFKGAIHQGQLELKDAPLVWTTVDPKTGEVISGTFGEIAAIAQDGMVAASLPDVGDELPF